MTSSLTHAISISTHCHCRGLTGVCKSKLLCVFRHFSSESFPLIYISIFCVLKKLFAPVLTESPSVQPSSKGKGTVKEIAQPNGKASKKNGKASKLFHWNWDWDKQGNRKWRDVLLVLLLLVWHSNCNCLGTGTILWLWLWAVPVLLSTCFLHLRIFLWLNS